MNFPRSLQTLSKCDSTYEDHIEHLRLMHQGGLQVDASCMLRYTLQTAKYVTRFVTNELKKEELVGRNGELLQLLEDLMFKINFDEITGLKNYCNELEKLCRNTESFLRKIKNLIYPIGTSTATIFTTDSTIEQKSLRNLLAYKSCHNMYIRIKEFQQFVYPLFDGNDYVQETYCSITLQNNHGRFEQERFIQPNVDTLSPAYENFKNKWMCINEEFDKNNPLKKLLDPNQNINLRGVVNDIIISLLHGHESLDGDYGIVFAIMAAAVERLTNVPEDDEFDDTVVDVLNVLMITQNFITPSKFTAILVENKIEDLLCDIFQLLRRINCNGKRQFELGIRKLITLRARIRRSNATTPVEDSAINFMVSEIDELQN